MLKNNQWVNLRDFVWLHRLKKLTRISFLGLITLNVPAMAELSGNIGITNNYVSRGFPLSNDKFSVSAGLDYAHHEKGFYAGFRAYTLNDAVPDGEIDAYLALTRPITSDLTYTLSLWSYIVTPTDIYSDHFEEIGLTLNYKNWLEVSAFRFLNNELKGDVYYSAKLSYPFALMEKEFVTVSATLGHNDYHADNDPFDLFDYTHHTLSATWREFTFAVETNTNDLINDDTLYTLTWRKYFNL